MSSRNVTLPRICLHHLRNQRSNRGNITKSLYKNNKKRSQSVLFSGIVSKDIMGFHENLYVIRKRNIAANMFASTSGATEAIVAALQSLYVKQQHKVTKFVRLLSPKTFWDSMKTCISCHQET